MKKEKRKQCIDNFQGEDFEELREAFEETVKEKDEESLPSLGIFFETIWENATDSLKQEMMDVLEERVKKGLEENL